MKIGIIGDGNVGSALARGLKRAGHEVRAVGNDGAVIRDTAASSELVVVAVPFGAIDDIVKAAGKARSAAEFAKLIDAQVTQEDTRSHGAITSLKVFNSNGAVFIQVIYEDGVTYQAYYPPGTI